MVDWNSPQTLAADAAAFSIVSFVFAGVYFWELVSTLDFDWSYVIGTRKMRWPMIFFFANRYLLLADTIALCVSQSVTKEIDCQPLYTFLQIGGNMASGFASINLSLRTIAVWAQNKWVTSFLVIAILGHWSLILQGRLVVVQWVPSQGCVVTHWTTRIIAAQYAYTMIFDFTVLCLMAWKLFIPIGPRGGLAKILFRDGLIYFLVAFILNLITVVFEVLALNPVMTVMFNYPTIVLSTIAATRAVRNLARHLLPGAEFLSITKPPIINNINLNVSSVIFRGQGQGHGETSESFVAGEETSDTLGSRGVDGQMTSGASSIRSSTVADDERVRSDKDDSEKKPGMDEREKVEHIV